VRFINSVKARLPRSSFLLGPSIKHLWVRPLKLLSPLYNEFWHYIMSIVHALRELVSFPDL